MTKAQAKARDMTKMYVVGLTAHTVAGWTGHDHLITDGDDRRAHFAVFGRAFASISDAEEAAYTAFLAGCDRRVATAKVVVRVRRVTGPLNQGEARRIAESEPEGDFWRV